MTEPPFEQILKMNQADLQQVSDFSISNEHGSISWLTSVDLTGVDLSSEITIESKSFEVFPGQTPPLGQKLNSIAVIRLNHIPPKTGQSVEEKEQKLRKINAVHGAEFLMYHPEKYYWEFKLN